MNATLLAMWQAVPDSQLKVSLDIAQLVMLGGLIWRLAEMSTAVKALTKVTGELTIGAAVFSSGLADLVTRVSVLEDRDNDRRDRRHDDA